MRKVIFPSAKIVPKELQGIGKLPAIIYPVDQKRMIDLYKEIYCSHERDVEFHIVAYEAYETVCKKIDTDGEVYVHKLDMLRDLGYTVYFALKACNLSKNDDVIINFADVMVFDAVSTDSFDTCFYAEESETGKWTFFKENQGVITELYDQLADVDSIPTKDMLIGIFYIADPMELLKQLEKALNEEKQGDSLYRALQGYSHVHPFEFRYANEWFDIGHLDKYYDTQLSIKSRTFNHITIDRDRGTLTKKSDDVDKFLGEIKWYLKLPTEIEYVRPRIFSYSVNYTDPYVTMEYYAYHTLHEIFLYGDISGEQWKNVFRRIRFILNDFRRYTVSDDQINEALYDMYVGKTLKRLEIFRDEKLIDADTRLVINGNNYVSLSELIERLPEFVKGKLMGIKELCIIHGDLCFSNIMVDPDYTFIKVIDPRGKFGKYDIYGDRRYEFAKILHSIEGKYDYIIKNMFELSCAGNDIEIRIDEGEKDDIILKCFCEVFEEEMCAYGDEIRLIEALLFLSMIPLHRESTKQQLAMLATGMTLLGHIVDIREEI